MFNSFRALVAVSSAAAICVLAACAPYGARWVKEGPPESVGCIGVEHSFGPFKQAAHQSVVRELVTDMRSAKSEEVFRKNGQPLCGVAGQASVGAKPSHILHISSYSGETRQDGSMQLYVDMTLANATTGERLWADEGGFSIANAVAGKRDETQRVGELAKMYGIAFASLHKAGFIKLPAGEPWQAPRS